jgi:hypothetical protein
LIVKQPRFLLHKVICSDEIPTQDKDPKQDINNQLDQGQDGDESEYPVEQDDPDVTYAELKE